MEIKYTLEILTKDIQDIGKLVGNLQNSPNGSTLELDLALSKLRNVYDILTVIRTDVSIPGLLSRQAQEAAPPPETVVETPAPPPPPVVETPQPDTEPVLETPKPEPELVLETPRPEPESEPVHEKDHPIIAEKFTTESSINENMAGNREPNLDAKLMGQPIDHIGRNIGINDRFLIIRELFDGDSDGFGKLIQDLDGAGSLQNAAERLQTQFNNSPDHEGVAILDNLVKRKYSKL